MTTFLRTKSGILINAANVTKIMDKRDDQGDDRAYAEWEGGGDWLHDYMDTDDVWASFQPIIPAEPGFSQVIAYAKGPIGKETLAFKSVPIIGWRWDGRAAHAITPEEQQVGYAIVYPRGLPFNQ